MGTSSKWVTTILKMCIPQVLCKSLKEEVFMFYLHARQLKKIKNMKCICLGQLVCPFVHLNDNI